MKKLLKWGHGIGLLLPSFACKQQGFVPGTEVRVLVLEQEIRIRHASLPQVDEFTQVEDVSVAESEPEPW